MPGGKEPNIRPKPILAGRIAWESKIFPELNVGYGADTRFWKQTEIRALISYARLRGVRLIPEIEMSTHAKALLPLVKTQGLGFCNESFPVMLFDDPAGKTLAVLKRLTTELAGPVQSQIRAPLFAARTLNATGQSRVTLSLQ